MSARRPTTLLVTLAIVAGVLSLAVAGLWWLDYRNGRAEQAREAALQAAREHVVPVLSYDYRSIDADLQRASTVLTGQYRDEFRTVATQITAPAAREQQITTRATVVASSVVRAEPERVVVLLFVNQNTRSSQSEAVQLSAHRLELTMTRVDDHWLISGLDRV